MEENLKKEKSRYHNQSIFIWIVVLVLAWTLGQYIIPEANGIFLGNSFAFSILSIILGYILFTITYEIGKIIFGLISKYRFVSTNILCFTYTKDKDNKTKFKFGKFTHYGGKTIMAPKSEDANLVLYSLGGTIFTVIINALFILLANLIAPNIEFEEWIYIQYIMSAVSFLILIFHLAPVLNDEIYDGFILRVNHANKNFKKVYHQSLLQEEAFITNKGELLYLDNIDFSNPLLVRASIFNYYYLMNNNKFNEAEVMVKKGLEHQHYLTDEEKGKLYSFKFFFMLMRNEEEKVGDEYFALERSIRKHIISLSNYETIKTALLIATFVESSYDLYEHILTKIDKAKEKYYLSRVNQEEALIEQSLDFIEKKKIDWFRPEELNKSE